MQMHHLSPSSRHPLYLLSAFARLALAVCVLFPLAPSCRADEPRADEAAENLPDAPQPQSVATSEEKTGPGKDAILKQAVAKMDEVIDWFARAVANSEGKAEFQAMNQQLMQNLESYYKFRHNGSTDGMSKIIDKYKKPTPQ